MKKPVLGMLFVLVTLLFGGCSSAASFPADSSFTEDALQKETGFDDDLENAVNGILQNADADFIGHNPVTENFFYWIAAHYGKDVLKEIAEEGDYSDPQIWYAKTRHSIHVLWDDYCSDYGLNAYEASHEREMQTAEDDILSIDFCGDVNLADGMATTNYRDAQPNGILDCFSEDLLDEMQSCDLFVVNNEFAYTQRGEALPNKAYTFRAHPNRVKDILAIGTDLVTVANNHVWDYGEIGMLDTIDTLEEAELPYIGAGRNLTEAKRARYYTFSGRKIAIVNATQIERSYTYTKEATEDMAGVLKTLNSDKFCEVIRDADKHADLVLVCVHWGTEGNPYYGADQVNLANTFIDAGADAIIGGHTHCLQGIEYENGVPVYYSLGNYWFSSTPNMPGAYDTGLARLEIHSDLSITAKFIPCRFSNGVTSKLVDEQKQDVYSLLEEYSNTTSIDENGVIKQR